MRKRSFTKDGHHKEIQVGTVVHIAAADVDRAKTDVANITGVVVALEHVDECQQYRVASHAGVLKACYARHQLRPLKTPPGLLGLDVVLQGWRGMSMVGERACMRLASAVGGQGVVHCNCLGKCVTGRCACRRAKPPRACNSRCHPRNGTCKNTADDV
jgi:hypothetical protein